MEMLNLGCGEKFHKKWVNIDFASHHENVIAHNLLKGIPFDENVFDVVYHSHVLEHFARGDGKAFITECYRVLKPGGILRVAVPDLEQIVKNYLQCLDGALVGDKESTYNYEWIMLELYDQTVRNQSGGEMAKFFYKENIENEEFVFSRIGQEGKQIRDKFLNARIKSTISEDSIKDEQAKNRLSKFKFYISRLKNLLSRKDRKKADNTNLYAEIGRFRLGGEIHQWMYDRYSLGKLLDDTGFANIQVTTAFNSMIPDWNYFELESRNGFIYKPDSLFVEAIKK